MEPLIPHFDQESPFPWQLRAYDMLRRGELPQSPLYLPTGTGKTSIALLYLLALIHDAPLPRRLVYIVDRRAIVDQTRDKIEEWVRGFADKPELVERINALAAFPATDPDAIIPVGVLRGGIADTGEWRIDPARPSVVVGTVDMIGSRLLFSGYGDGRSRRALHAGLLGHDATIILDEAHLSAPMDNLLRSIDRMQRRHNGQTTADGQAFRTISMSATPLPDHVVRRAWERTDEGHPAFRARIHAGKRCRLHAVGPRDIRAKMVDVAQSIRTGAVIIYVRTVSDAKQVHSALARSIGDKDRCRLLTGTLRGRERRLLFESEFWKGFRPSRRRGGRPRACYLVSTSAGEVGIDIDADHAVMDLTTMDGMVQRLGRVNRNGELKRSNVHVVHDANEVDQPKQMTLRLLKDIGDLSPARIADLAESADDWSAAFATPPATAPIDAYRVEWLAATSNPRRDPAIPIFLRGIPDKEDVPDVQVVWRWDLPVLMKAGTDYLATALDAFPPLPEELLTVPVRFAVAEIKKLSERATSLMLRDRQGAVRVLPCSPDDLAQDLAYGTVFLPAEAGGLNDDGLLSGGIERKVLDCGDNETRVRYETGNDAEASIPVGWDSDAKVVLRVPIHGEDHRDDYDEEPEGWLIYRKRNVGELTLSDQDQLTAIGHRPQTLTEHSAAVAEAPAKLAQALSLPEETIFAMREAGDWHDRGKSDSVWQRAAGASLAGEPIAKSRTGGLNVRLLAGYRHEFGSLLQAEEELQPGPDGDGQRDLILHLIAAHHGHARPGFAEKRHWGQAAPDGRLEDTARRTEVRFAELQRRYGPWRLAWLEAIVKAADAWVSSRRDAAQ